MKQHLHNHNLKQNKMKAMKSTFLLFLFVAAFAHVSKAQVTINVDTGMNWVGYMNVFDSTGSNYIFGSSWAVPDMKTVVDPGNGTLELKPNYNTYANAANAADSAFWHNGAMGNKIMEANTFVEDLALLGQNVTFSGIVDSATIAAGYTVNAFIKVLDANNNYSLALYDFDTITATGAFSVNVNIPNTAGFIPQYGFTVRGLNGNPAAEIANGKILIRGNQAPPAPLINVTFQVQNPDSTPVYVFGSWSNWSNWPGTLMTATTNGIYEVSLMLPASDTVEYLYVNGIGTKETLSPTDPCTNGNVTYTNRMTVLDTMDVTYCTIWESCTTCSPAGINDLSEDKMNVRISNKTIFLESLNLTSVDGIEIFDILGSKIFSTNGKVSTNQAININLETNKFYLVRIANKDSFRTIKTFIEE